MGKIANTNITIANPLPNTGNQSRSSSASSQGNISLIDPKKQALMDKFHISLEQCNALLEKHPEIIGLDNEQELNEIVSNFLNPKPKTKYKAFDPKEYNNSTVDQKKQTGDYEFARNIYIYGFKGDDKYVRTIPAHSVEAWEQLPDSEKADFISKVVNKVKSIRDNDKNLKEIFINLENGDRKLTDENIVDIGVEALQVANANNMSIQDFMKLKPTQRIDLIYTYLGKQSAENLSNSQFDTLKFFRAMKENIKNYLKDNFGEELTDDVSMSEVFQIAGDYNLSKEKVQFDILANKVNRTSEEEEQYQRLKDIFETPAGQDIVDKLQNY